MRNAQTAIRGWLASAIADPPTSTAALTAQAAEAISNTVAGAIVNALSQSGYPCSGTDHVLCDFLASAACMMQKFQEQFERGVTRMVTTVLRSRTREHRSAIPRPVAELAAQAAVDALMNLAPAHHFDDLLRGLQISAISACPAPERHRAVVRCCLNPLAKDILSDAIKQELTDAAEG